MSPVILSAQHPLSAGLTGDSRLVRAYRGERSDTTPVWFMRQARIAREAGGQGMLRGEDHA